jgi:hypothetical protein
MERELQELRAQVSKQERALQNTAERLKTANQQKESMEQFIVSQRRCHGAGKPQEQGSSRHFTCVADEQ